MDLFVKNLPKLKAARYSHYVLSPTNIGKSNTYGESSPYTLIHISSTHRHYPVPEQGDATCQIHLS